MTHEKPVPNLVEQLKESAEKWLPVNQYWELVREAAEELEKRITPEKLSAAMDRLTILDNTQYDPYVAPTRWFVVDNSTTEPNWPGDPISEHASRAEAKIGLAKALIDMATR